MKKIIIITLFMCFIFILSNVTMSKKDIENVETDTQSTIKQSDNIQLIIAANAKEKEEVKFKNTIEDIDKVTYKNIIYTGDSRFVGMECVANDELFIAEVGQGYNYFIENLNLIKNSYTENDLIVIGFGVNDLYNIDKYIETVNELTMEYNIAYLSINPIDENIASNLGYAITNKDIDDFNEKLQENLNESVLYIDSNNYLKETGFNSPDGLHYDKDTYKKIYLYINEKIQ